MCNSKFCNYKENTFKSEKIIEVNLFSHINKISINNKTGGYTDEDIFGKKL